MKVTLGTNAASTVLGGMGRVHTGLFTWLPKYGIDIVDTVEEADVVHAHINVYEKLPAYKPLVVSSHGMLWDSIWGKSAWYTNHYLVESYRLADVITTPSHFVAEAIARNMLTMPRVVHHGIDSDEWLPDTNEGYVLWNKARVDAANEPAEMNRLAEMSPAVNFRSTFGEAKNNVKIVGTIEPAKMPDFVKHAAVYLDTPLESGGPCFGVLEAMSCGVPVLAWNNGGNAESIIHKETGYLAEPGNYADLYEGLQYCLAERDRLGVNGRQLVIDKYQWPTVIQGYIKAYEEAIAAHQHPVKVSVIVPCYNLGRFLPNCITSITTQTYKDLEIIVVDDNSTDNSYEVAQQLATTDPRIKLFKNELNVHVSETRNRAIVMSKGEYILPLDADDRLAFDAVENLVKTLDTERDIDMVSGALNIFHESDPTKGYNGGWPNNADYNLQITGYNRLPYASMYRRKVWDQVGGYRRRIRSGIEDGDFWTRALSYGHKAKIIEPVTLLYTSRDNSLRSKNPHGASAWLTWFPWAQNPEVTPFGAVGEGPYSVDVIKPKVSVIVPVGPGHTQHIQGCLDSLIAQTYQDWEAIVINDTGQRWFDDNGKPLTHYVKGFPFVTFIDGDKNYGVAHARNLGIKAARTDKIVFLDVDDIAQPPMLDVLVKAHVLSDGWIYGDWLVYDGDKITPSEAPDWSTVGLMAQSLAPITGIYHKNHIEEVGGFDEKAPGWEDWDFQLGLLERGICGTRIKFPLMSYHMHLGGRREDNFSQRQDLVKYIVDKHPLLYGKGADVACRKCGGQSTLKVQINGPTETKTEEVHVLIKYDGPETNVRLFKSPSKPNQPPYKVSNKEPFYVLQADVAHFTSRRGFSIIETPKPAAVTGALSDLPLVSEAPRVPVEAPTVKVIAWDNLTLKPELITILKNNFASPEEVMLISDTALLAIKGMGPARLSTVRKALSNA